MKNCEWCDKEMKRQNYDRHLKSCFYLKELDMKRSDFLRLKGNDVVGSDQYKKIEIVFEELKHFLTDSYNKTNSLYKRVIVSDARNPIERLREMMCSEVTKQNYIREWKLYSQWCSENSKTVSKESANTYLANIKCKASTLKKKQLMIQTILQFLIDSNIQLNKVSMRITYQPKYAMTSEEITDYLEEQKEHSENYLIQRLMLTYGLRINTIALLKRKHLTYMDSNVDKIFLPDSKVKRERHEIISEDLQELIDEFAENKKDEEYVFYYSGSCFNERKRAMDLCIRINKCIRSSKVLKRNKNYNYSSHMFRKTVAYNLYQDSVNKAKAEARAAIGQSQNSTAIESYIHL